MSTPGTATAVQMSIVVDAPIADAFEVFTADIASWFPREYNLLDTPIVTRTFEPHVGGHVYDTGEDGKECHWARVLAWEPPNRVVFSWDISPQWQIETEPEKTSEVEVRFTADGPDRTRLDLEHRNLDRHGEGWEQLSSEMSGESAWTGVLALYQQRIAG